MSALIEIQGLHFDYPDGVAALRDLSLSVESGERWGIVGGNGSGKSTLLHHVAGLYPSGGHLRIDGVTASRENLSSIRERVGFVFQAPEHQLFMPTLREDVSFGPMNLGVEPDEVTRRVDAALSRVGLLGKAERPPHHLSGGERRGAALATVLVLEPSILALDEPTNDLDPAGRREILTFLKEWQGTLLVATHDLELVLEVATHVAVLDAGTVAATGTPREILGDAKEMQRYRLEVPLSLR